MQEDCYPTNCTLPSANDAARIATDVLAEPVTRVERFATGAANRVYDVTSCSGRRVVVRIMRSADQCAAAVQWSRALRPLGVPLPRILAHEIAGNAGAAWMVLDRLPGTDLAHAHGALTPSQRRDVCDGVVAAQRIVASSLPRGGGFGYVNRPRDWPHATWGDVVAAELSRSRGRIERVGAVDPRQVDRVEALGPRFERYFASVPPTPFLDDTTTRNVIVHDGRLSGIVDVDSICYGDALFTVGLTRMALLSLAQPTAYTDHWLDRVDASEEQRRAVAFYTAVFCVNFLGEQGQQFNLDAPPAVDPREVGRLEAILDRLLAELEGRV